MTNTEYLDDQDAEEPDDFIISLTAQVCVSIFVLKEAYYADFTKLSYDVFIMRS